MKKKWILIVLTMLLVFVMGACQQVPVEKSQTSKPIIAVTIAPQQTFVKAIAGDAVEVITMVPSGSSPETYEPSPQQMADFSKASLYFTIGLAVEETKVLPQIGKVPIVDLAKVVRDVYPDRLFEEGERDEHIWLSSKRVQVMVETMAEELIDLFPENAESFQKNSLEYVEKLTKLEKELQGFFKTMEPKIFVVYHPAFGYLAEDYGLTMVALEEEGKESTPQQLQSVIDLAKERNLKKIFYQQEVDSRQSISFAEEIKGTAVKLDPLSADYIDNLREMARAIAGVK